MADIRKIKDDAFHNREMEELLISELMIITTTIDDIYPIIEDKDVFYFDDTKEIWNFIKKSFKNNLPVDLMLIKNNTNIPIIKLTNLATKAASNVNAKQHALYLYELYIRRQLYNILSKNEKELESGEKDIKNVYNNLENDITDLFSINIENGSSLNDIITNTLINIKKKIDGKTFPRIYSKTDFDKIINFSSGELIWLAGIPKASKTRSIAYILYNLYKNNQDKIAVRWFSMEDPTDVILSYLTSIETNIPFDKIHIDKKENKPTEEEFKVIEENMNLMRGHNIYISYGSNTVDNVYAQTKSFIKKNKNKINIIVIDNFNILVRNQKKHGSKVDIEDEVAGKIQKIKIDSNDEGYNTIVIVLDHLNKEAISINGLKRAYRPNMKDLKGTGSKLEILTQLISINMPRLFPELIEQQSQLPNKVYASNVIHRRKDILERLIIYENLLSRNKKDDNILRMIADLNTFRFFEYETVKKEQAKKK